MKLSRFKSILRGLSIVALSSFLFACASTGPAGQHPLDSSSIAQQHRTVALLGATGMVGRFIIRESLARGYSVRALARTPAKLDEYQDQIEVVKGDARDSAVIRQLLTGSDVVLSALGPVKADGDAAKFVSTAVAANILQEMQNQAISQYILVSGGGVVIPTDKRNLMGWWIRTLVRLGLRGTLADKQAEYALLANSSADWTLVRAPLIDPEPFIRPALVSLKTPPAFRLRAAELARFMVDQIESREYIRQGPFLGSRSK
ncbi:MAG: putative NADH-flavin reductase [Cryomorphaceae bacterium]|jgi:putative NADH-flavin reductase